MTTFTDLYNDLKFSIENRIKNPLVGSFTLSWLLLNWDFILLLIAGDLGPVERIRIIKTEILTSNVSTYTDYIVGDTAVSRMIFAPLFSTAFFIFILPFASQICYGVTLKFKKKMRELKRSIEDQEMLTKEEASNLRLRMDSVLAERKKIVHERDAEIERLTAALTSSNSEKTAHEIKLLKTESALKYLIENPMKPNVSNPALAAFRKQVEGKIESLALNEGAGFSYPREWFTQLFSFWTKLNEQAYKVTQEFDTSEPTNFKITIVRTSALIVIPDFEFSAKAQSKLSDTAQVIAP